MLQDMEHMLYESDLYIYAELPLTQDDTWQLRLTEGRGETTVEIGDDSHKMNGALKPKKASKKLRPPTYFFESSVLGIKSKQYFHLDLVTYIRKGQKLRAPSNTDFGVSDKKQDLEAKLSHVRYPSRYIITQDPHLLSRLHEINHIRELKEFNHNSELNDTSLIWELQEINHIIEATAFWISSLVEFPEGLEHVLLMGKVMIGQQMRDVPEEKCVRFSELLGERLKQEIPGFRASVTVVIMPRFQKGHQESWHGRHIYTSYAHHILDDSTAVFKNGRVYISDTFTIPHQLFAYEEYQSRMSHRLISTCGFIEKYAPNHGSVFANWMRGWMKEELE